MHIILMLTDGQKYTTGMGENVRVYCRKDVCYLSSATIMDSLVANLTALGLTGATRLVSYLVSRARPFFERGRRKGLVSLRTPSCSGDKILSRPIRSKIFST